jgi:hypothetical protein
MLYCEEGKREIEGINTEKRQGEFQRDEYFKCHELRIHIYEGNLAFDT